MLGIARKWSAWLYKVNTGACNGCDIEVIACITPRFDVERFGMKVVGTPRQADVLIVTGPVTEQTAERLKRIYELMPYPKVVVSVGSCAISGGIFVESYSVRGGADAVIPVNVYVPGCPPRPQAIISGLMRAIEILSKKRE